MFEKGDAVTAFGNVGVVKAISHNGMFVEVKFDDAICTTIFCIDGRILPWAKEPSLVKVPQKVGTDTP